MLHQTSANLRSGCNGGENRLQYVTPCRWPPKNCMIVVPGSQIWGSYHWWHPRPGRGQVEAGWMTRCSPACVPLIVADTSISPRYQHNVIVGTHQTERVPTT